MLIEFNVKNFRSIRERQTLLMTAGNAKKGEPLPENVFSVAADSTFRLLRSCAIYGANASGKSNLLMAFGVMQQVIADSAKAGADAKLPLQPFLLNSQTAMQPSEFEAHFIADGMRFQYGFAADAGKIHSEWLFAYPNGRPQQWFSREWKNQRYQWRLGSHLSGQKKVWQNATRDNALFLSTAIQLNSAQLRPVFQWFKETMQVVPSVESLRAAGFTSAQYQTGRKQRENILNFLKSADIGIEDIHIKEGSLNAEPLPAEIPPAAAAAPVSITTVRKNEYNVPVELDFACESDGSQRFYALAGPWLDTLKNGRVLIIDELSQHLHANLVEFLVRMFNDPRKNTNGAQLIFSTHETSLLQQSMLRRDQIWFCDKPKNATALYSLSDYHVRSTNIEAAYLAGKYHAVPNIAEHA